MTPTVNPVFSHPVPILESVTDEMACEESCTHDPDQEVRPSLAVSHPVFVYS